MSGKSRPADWVAHGQWPNATLIDGTPAEIRATQRVARLVEQMIGDAGWTIHETARAARVHPNTIRRLLTGKHIPSTSTVISLLGGLRGRWKPVPPSTDREIRPRFALGRRPSL